MEILIYYTKICFICLQHIANFFDILGLLHLHRLNFSKTNMFTNTCFHLVMKSLIMWAGEVGCLPNRVWRQWLDITALF